jgi:intergrase/recombinase
LILTTSSLFEIARFLLRERNCLGSLAWWGTALVSSEAGDLTDFKNWLETKEYAKSYIQSVLPYAKKYHYILDNGNLRDLDLLSNHRKAHAVKALTLLSKFRGNYLEFKAKLAKHGFKWERTNGLRAFLRIFNATNNEVMKWYNEARSNLRENEALYTKFLLYGGLRVSEAIKSFNLIIKMSRENKLLDYYDSEFQVLCHFKHPKLFIRRTKNCYITFLQPDFIKQLADSQKVSYLAMRKRLNRKHLRLRFNELRDKFGTYLLSHRILEAEINLLQGRIPVDVFIRHYWSPKLKELSNRIFEALENIEKQE